MAAQAFANSDRLIQVITNLLTDAIHYNSANGDVSVKTRSEPDAAVITISDTGGGIAEADIPASSIVSIALTKRVRGPRDTRASRSRSARPLWTRRVERLRSPVF